LADSTKNSVAPQLILMCGWCISNGRAYSRRFAKNRKEFPGLCFALGWRHPTRHRRGEDSVGNITGITDALNAGYNRTFAYDDLNRLGTANSGTALWGSATGNGYTYDAMGNMLGLKLGTSRTVTFNYRAGGVGSTGLPQLASVTENGAVRNVSYDAIGSELGDGRNTFTYGARELLGANLPNVQSYAYDGFRRRVQSQLPNGNQRASFFDPADRLLAETAQSVASPPALYDYVWFGDRPVAQLDGTATHWTYADHLGTPLLQTEANGTVSWQAEHEPYGSVWVLRSGDVHQPLRFPGQSSEQFDAGANGLTELNYNNARWYRPGWGRYASADPIGSVGGLNLFEYGLDNPLSRSDFAGLAPAKRPYDDPYCVALRETIQNIFDRINRRTGQHDENLGQLPERAPGDVAKPSGSRFGHRILINMDKALLAQRRAEYDANCDDPSGPLSCPATLPTRARGRTAPPPEPPDRFSPEWWWWVIVVPKPIILIPA
jgi:RHS repeat-associated protein